MMQNSGNRRSVKKCAHKAGSNVLKLYGIFVYALYEFSLDVHCINRLSFVSVYVILYIKVCDCT